MKRTLKSVIGVLILVFGFGMTAFAATSASFGFGFTAGTAEYSYYMSKDSGTTKAKVYTSTGNVDSAHLVTTML